MLNLRVDLARVPVVYELEQLTESMRGCVGGLGVMSGVRGAVWRKAARPRARAQERRIQRDPSMRRATALASPSSPRSLSLSRSDPDEHLNSGDGFAHPGLALRSGVVLQWKRGGGAVQWRRHELGRDARVTADRRSSAVAKSMAPAFLQTTHHESMSVVL